MAPDYGTTKTRTAIIKRTPAYRQSLARAAKLLKHPDRLDKLVAGAMGKVSQRRTLLAGIGEALNTAFRLVSAYSAGRYRAIPWRQMVLLIAALLYLVVPTDLVPDIILAVGYIDDAMLLTWTLQSLSEELRRFRDWEKTHIAPDSEYVHPAPGS